MKIKSILLASAVVIAGISGANAADAIVYNEPAPVVNAPAFSWTGGYLGGQVGYGWSKSRFSNAVNGIDLKPDGFLGGLYAGYNFDMGNSVVLGVDGDITYNNLKDTYSDTIDGVDESLENKMRWSGALRARAGYEVDRFLPYIAGGVAFGSVKNTFSLSEGEDSLTASQSKTLTGWTLGAGVDYAATNNVVVRLEYRYTDYGRKDFTASADGLELGGSNKFKTNEVRLGIAYKF